MGKGARFSQDELNTILTKNKHVQINKQKIEKTRITTEKTHKSDELKEFLNQKIQPEAKVKIEKQKIEKEKKKNPASTTDQINKINKEAITQIKYDDSYIGILFEGARLFSMNQLFNIMQYKPYEMFKYKKIWHEKIQQLLALQQNLPFFQAPVEITIFRQAPKLVDEDAQGTMFKYIIDALKKEHKAGYLGVLSDDDTHIVKRIILEQTKGKYFVGIKIQDISETYQEIEYQPNMILTK